MNLKQLLSFMIEKKASDLHLRVNSVPILRINGKLFKSSFPKLTPADLESAAFSLMNDAQRRIFKQRNECDLSYSCSGVGRFRVNIFVQRGTICIVLRAVMTEIPDFESLHLPPVLGKMVENERGLVLATGTTGSGKSTTLAAMLNHINQNRSCHIITIEDPIEYLFRDKKCIITQREIGLDTLNYAEALQHVVRQDPDVIMIGEMRDRETMSAALTAAQLGHLVLSSVHTIDAVQTISRIVDLFPPHQQPQVRLQLSDTLKGIVSLRLLPLRTGDGRIPAVETLVSTPLIKKYILENTLAGITEQMEMGEFYGMKTFNQALLELYRKNLVTLEDALAAATVPEELMMRVRGIEPGTKET